MCDLDINNTSCCGVDELHGIADESPEDILEALVKELYHPPRPELSFDYKQSRSVKTGRTIPEKWTTNSFYIFTQANNTEDDDYSDYGEELAEFIHKHKLGEVATSATRRNPNSDNDVTVYVWAVDREAFHKFAKQKYLEVKTDDGKSKSK